jgi:hypothetical protein
MKTNGTRSVLFIGLFLLISLLITISGLAQPDYIFKNPTHISGTDRKVGAKYRYDDVRPGTDCIVTITDIKKVTLNQLDGASGYEEAFQPYIFCPAKTKGFVEFRFDFVRANTTTPKVMTEIPVTAIDVDGYINPDEKVYEFDEFNLTLGYLVNYDLLGSALQVNLSGLDVKAINKTAVDYPGIDTTRKDVMFSMTYANVSSITIRAGVDNRSKEDIERLRSDYFKKFQFANSFLAQPALSVFSGNERNKKVDLQFSFKADSRLSSVTVEKASNPNSFQAVGDVKVDATGVQKNYSFSDMISGNAYYRLKMVTADGSVQYSNILIFRTANGGSQQPFNVFPTSIQSSATVSVKADKAGKGRFQVIDYSGRVVMQQDITVQQGANNIVVNNMSKINTGNYVALIKLDDNQVYNQKIVKQ